MEGLICGVDEVVAVVVNVVGVVIVGGSVMVFCDLWDDLRWIDVEEEESEVGLSDVVDVVGDGSLCVSE